MDENENRVSEIGNIPNDWKILQIKEIGDVITGMTPSTKIAEYYNGEYLFISPGDIGESKYIIKTEKSLTKKGLDKSRLLSPNTVLVVCIGATIGKTAMTLINNSVTNQQINAIIPNKTILSHFLYYAMVFRAPFLPSLAGRSAVPIVNKSNFLLYKIPYPPLTEQHSIAYVLSRIQKAIEVQDRIIAATKELKKVLMQKLFTEGLHGEELKDTEIGKMPNSWHIIRLEEICERIKQSDPMKNPEMEFEYIDVSSVSNEFYRIINTTRYNGTEAPSRARKGIRKQDIIYATVRPYLKRIALVPNSLDGQVCSTAFCVLRGNQNVINPFYLFHFMLTDPINNRIIEHQKGSSYPAILDSDIMNQYIPLPSISEQKEIADILETINTLIFKIQNNINKYQQLFKSMLNLLMTGKVRVKDLEVPDDAFE